MLFLLLILLTLPPPPLERPLVVDGVDRLGVVFIAAVAGTLLVEKKSVSKKPPPTAVWVAEPFDPDIVIGLSNAADDDVDVAKGSEEPNASKLILLLSLLRCGVDGDVNRCVAYLLLLLLLSFVGDIIFVSILYAAVGGGTLPLPLLCL